MDKVTEVAEAPVPNDVQAIVLKVPDGFMPSTAPHPIHDDPSVPRPRIAHTLGGARF
ncbi:hypothetical protein PQQ51_04760 [Paraburkholderia xenovorans]|uniref:hypothetical protein n=1 Tax=Paraburkholderia xenovorans TaxID=36873 RepID=UPI0038B6F61F